MRIYEEWGWWGLLLSNKLCMDGWMDRWIDGSMDGWMDRSMDRSMDGWMHACMHVCMYVCVYKYIYIYIYIFTYQGKPETSWAELALKWHLLCSVRGFFCTISMWANVKLQDKHSKMCRFHSRTSAETSQPVEILLQWVPWPFSRATFEAFGDCSRNAEPNNKCWKLFSFNPKHIIKKILKASKS